MSTITLKDLENAVARLNRSTNSPLESYTKADNKFTANVGNYHLDGAYGGYSLCRMSNASGGGGRCLTLRPSAKAQAIRVDTGFH